jgi:hypothetical protein
MSGILGLVVHGRIDYRVRRSPASTNPPADALSVN